MTSFESTVASYQGLDPLTATNDQVDAAYDDIASAWGDVVDDADGWADADDNALTEALIGLDDAVHGLPGDNTAAENLQDLEDELAAFPQAVDETFDGSGCETGE